MKIDSIPINLFVDNDLFQHIYNVADFKGYSIPRICKDAIKDYVKKYIDSAEYKDYIRGLEDE